MEIIRRVLPIQEISVSGRLATKYLQKTDDGFVIEATHIRRPEKHSLCVSTQVGCVVGCRFCASGLRSEGKIYQRSLTASEMVEQCYNIANEIDFKTYPNPLTFAFMGEGEPFLNFEECVTAFNMLGVREWIVPVKLSVSTSGVRPDLIKRLAEIKFQLPFKLQVSLHGSTDEIRLQIMPVSKPLAEIVAAVRVYREKCNRPVVWNYVLCAGANDQLEHAEGLVRLLGSGWQVKLTRLNPTPGSPFRPPSVEQSKRFCDVLQSGGLIISYSETDESNIYGGCGQLSYSYPKK